MLYEVITGTAFFEDLGIELCNVKLSDLGTAKRVVISRENTMIIDGGGSKKAIQGRIEQIKSEIENTTSDYDKEKLQERLAKLSGRITSYNVCYTKLLRVLHCSVHFATSAVSPTKT